MFRIREGKGMTQTDLARTLKTAYGLPFHQQTIQRIESGERPVRLNEANLIALILRTDLFQMMSTAGWGSPENVQVGLEVAGMRLAKQGAEIAEYLSKRMKFIEEVRHDVEDDWAAYVATQEELGAPIDDDLSADVRRFERRYERAHAAWVKILELGDV